MLGLMQDTPLLISSLPSGRQQEEAEPCLAMNQSVLNPPGCVACLIFPKKWCPETESNRRPHHYE